MGSTKVRYIKTQRLKAFAAKIKNLDVENLSLGGRNVNCLLSQNAVKTEVNTFVPLDAPAPSNVNPLVYQALVENANANGQDLQNRLYQGRTNLNSFLTSYPCPTSCPPPTTSVVPMNVYGALTKPIFERMSCGDQCGCDKVNYLNNFTSAMNFNLQAYYNLEETQAVDARVVSVLIQVGYIDPESPPNDPQVIITEVFVANKQFYPTLDTEYGENFANKISIPSDLVASAAFAMPDPNNTAAVQMVVYKEQGICIWKASGDGFECRGGGGNTQNASASSDVQSQIPCPRGQRQALDKDTNRTFCLGCNAPCPNPLSCAPCLL